jgi:hypothetical protein
MRTASFLRAFGVVVAVAVTGCGDPYADELARPASPASTAYAASPRATDRPGPSAQWTPSVAARPAWSARRAARAFARGWLNWDWRTAASQQRALARLATGALAQQLRANADSARIDASLARDNRASRGTVAAINLSASDVHAAGIVVTREQTYTGGRADLGGRRYRVYVVRLRHGHGWEVTAWEPQP